MVIGAPPRRCVDAVHLDGFENAALLALSIV